MFPYLLLSALATSLVAASLTWQAASFANTLDDARIDGRNLYSVQAVSAERPAQITRASCEALTSVPGVVRAGILVPSGRDEVLPVGSSVPLIAASTTLVPMLSEASAVLGRALRPSSFSGNLRIGGVEAAAVNGVLEPAGIDVNSAVVVPLGVATRSSESCIVEINRLSSAEQATWLSAQLRSDGGPLAVSPVRRETVSLVESYLTRAEMWLPLLAGAGGGLATGLAIRMRRSDLAAYLFSGTSKRDLALLLSIECLALTAVAAASGLGAVLALGWMAAGIDVRALSILSMGGCWASVAIAVGVPAVLRSAVGLGKGR